MPTLDTFIALRLATLLGVRWRLLRSQICISMTTDDVEALGPLVSFPLRMVCANLSLTFESLDPFPFCY